MKDEKSRIIVYKMMSSKEFVKLGQRARPWWPHQSGARALGRRERAGRQWRAVRELGQGAQRLQRRFTSTQVDRLPYNPPAVLRKEEAG